MDSSRLWLVIYCNIDMNLRCIFITITCGYCEGI